MRRNLFSLVLSFFLLCFAVFLPTLGIEVPERPRPDDLDNVSLRVPTAVQLSAAGDLQQQLPGLTLRWDGLSASPRWLAAMPGRTLSGPSKLTPEKAARTYLHQQANLFGLLSSDIDELQLTSSVPAPNGGTHLYFTQRVGGLDVFGGRLNITLLADRSVHHLGARLYAGIEAPVRPTLPATEAVSVATRNVYRDIIFDTQQTTSVDREKTEQLTVFLKGEYGRQPQARLVLFPESEGFRLAWEVRVAEPSLETDYRLLIDAQDGTLLSRHNLTQYADVRVLQAHYPDPEMEEYAPPQHLLTSIPGATTESPQGWFGGDDTTMAGNNATSHLGHRTAPGLAEPDGLYDYSFNTNEAALANVWYWINDAHDRFRALGFDEAAGNFQLDNFGLGGIAGDPVAITALPSRGSPYFSPAIDGEIPSLYLGWMTGGYGFFGADHNGYPDDGADRSVGFMRELIYHEYAHGVTTRRVGGPAVVDCFTGEWQAQGISEGYSQIFPASFFDHPAMGEYLTYSHGVDSDLREEPYWGSILWYIRQSMIALDPANGLDDFHNLLIEALTGTPCDPTIIDGRDAILAADTLLFASAHHGPLWNIFADHYIGELASSPSQTQLLRDETVPAAFVCTPPPTPTLLSVSTTGSNAVQLDYDATGATAVEIWREDASFLADAPERIAFATDSATYTDYTVQGGKSYRYHMVSLGEAGSLCRSAPSGMADITATGNCDAEFPIFIPNLTITDGNPDCSLSLSWNPATEACPGSGQPIIYNIYRAPTPGFLPSDRALIGRTAATTFSDIPPQLPDNAQYGGWFAGSHQYMVLAQHGTLADPPDHRDRGASQVRQWRGAIPTLGRTTTAFWDFESGEQGWTEQNWTGIPDANWDLVSPHPTYYGGALQAPDEAAGGSGQAWVTVDAINPELTDYITCVEGVVLWSPPWDASDGSTIVSFDYWHHFNSYEELYSSFWIVFGTGSSWPSDNFGIRDIGLHTVQRFNGPGRYGWQHYEIDLSRYREPTDGMKLMFAGADCDGSEFGIDNVRVERATVCSRSNLVIDSVTVDDSTPGWGNGNGYLEPGEIATLSVDLLNTGSNTALTPNGTVASGEPGIVVLDSSSSYPDINSGAVSGSLADDFIVHIPEGGCLGTSVFEFIFTDGAGVRTTELWSPEIGEVVTDVILEDNFETNKGWTSTWNNPLVRWDKGVPNATWDGAVMANPGFDSPDDTGDQCFVTGNRPGAVDLYDVDPGDEPTLISPALNLDGYKQVRFTYDHWLYREDGHSEDGMRSTGDTEDGQILWSFFDNNVWSEPNQWWPTSFDIYENLSQINPLGSDVHISFTAYDDGTDDIVEVGIDNVRIEGDRQVCDPVGVNAPNNVGDTVLADKAGAAVVLGWDATVIDATHDAAVFYKVYVAGTPDGEYNVKEAPFTITASRPLTNVTEYYLLKAANGGGSSAEDPN